MIPARGKGIVKTDLSIAAPPGTYARIAPRSGLAVKKFIDTGAGVVDEDYRGAVGVVLFNHSDEDFEVKKGDRVAQMILERTIRRGVPVDTEALECNPESLLLNVNEDVGELFGEGLRLGQLFVVAQEPLAVLSNVGDIVAAAQVGSNMRKESGEAVGG